MCSRTFRRFASHYLSNLYLKEPYTIGYPTNVAIEREVESLKVRVFQSKSPEELYSDTDPAGKPWSQLTLYEQSKYSDLAVKIKPKYTSSIPERVSGFSLFRELHSYISTESVVSKNWHALDQKYRDIYSDPLYVDRAFKERMRIWQGYEIVHHLKLQSNPPVNPFVYLGLYPWEVVTHKLRSRTKKKQYSFEIDYYDRLIKESFRRFPRTALNIFYNDLRHIAPDRAKFTYQTVETLFKKRLSEQERNFYKEKCQNHNHFQLTNRAVGRGSNKFLRYVLELQGDQKFRNYAYSDIVKVASEHWKGFKDDEKNKYKYALTGSSRENQDLILKQKVDIVMRYIYEVGGVIDIPADYNWREDMKVKENWKIPI